MNGVVGVHGKKAVITDCVIYTQPLIKFIKMVNAVSFPGFHIHKQMPHPPSFGMGRQSVYLVVCMVITHKIFINRIINRCMLVKWFTVIISFWYLKWFVLVTKTLLHTCTFHWRPKNSNGASTSTHPWQSDLLYCKGSNPFDVAPGKFDWCQTRC